MTNPPGPPASRFTAKSRVSSTQLTLPDLAHYAGLLACAGVCVETSRQLGETAGLARGLQSAWTLPIALLLPPVYGLLAPVPLKALSQCRVGRSLLHRRVLSLDPPTILS